MLEPFQKIDGGLTHSHSQGLDEELNAHALDTLRPLASLAALLYSFLTLSHFLLLPPSQRIALASLASLTALSAGLLLFRWRISPPQAENAAGWTAFIVGLGCVNSLTHLYLTQDVKHSTNMALMIIGSGHLFLRPRLLCAVLAMEILSWAVVLYAAKAANDIAHYLFFIIFSGFLSVLLHQTRIGAIRRSHSLRLLEAEKNKALRHSQNTLLQLLTDSWLMSWRSDKSGAVDFVNDTWWEFTGHPKGGALGCNLMHAIHPSDRSKYLAAFQEATRSRKPFDLEYRLRRHDGAYRWVGDKGWPYTDFSGEFAGYVGVAQDISPRREAEAALRASNDRFQMVIEAADIGTIEWRLDTELFSAPRLWSSLLGYRDQEPPSRISEILPAVHPEDVKMLRTSIEWFRNNPGIDQNFTLRMRHQDRKYRWIRFRAKLVIVEGDPSNSNRVLGIAEDFTHWHAVEEEHRQLEAQVQHAQKLESLGVLAGGIAHDFNNILTSVLGHADLARCQEPAGNRAREHLDIIVAAAQRAANLCRQLLAYSGKGHAIIETIDLSSIVREMAKMLEVTISKKSRLHLDLASPLPCIQAGSAQIQQVIMNLITNASDALEGAPGDIRVRTGACACDTAYLQQDYIPGSSLLPGNYVFVEVQDTGCGFDDATRQRIFEPFFSTKFTGRGLGLAAVLGIVRSHSGVLKIASQPKRGSVFKVLFPVSDLLPEASPRTQPRLDQHHAKGTILLADDEQSVRELTSLILTGAGYKVLQATDGEHAVAMFSAHKDSIHAIVLDLTMPRLNGLEVLERIAPIRGGVPVVLASGYSNALPFSPPASEREITAFLPKPFMRSDLLAILKKMINASRHPQQPAANPNQESHQP